MMDRLEKNSGHSVVTQKEAEVLLKEDDDLIIAVYDYWLNKRLKTVSEDSGKLFDLLINKCYFYFIQVLTYFFIYPIAIYLPLLITINAFSLIRGVRVSLFSQIL